MECSLYHYSFSKTFHFAIILVEKKNIIPCEKMPIIPVQISLFRNPNLRLAHSSIQIPA